jgi:uncharacterized membrane protein
MLPLKGIPMNITASSPLHDVGQNRRTSSQTKTQTLALVIGGSLLALYGLTRRSAVGMAVAGSCGALAYYGLRSTTRSREYFARSSVLLSCSPSEAFTFWKEIENFPRFMRHIEAVTTSEEGNLRWAMRAPFGGHITWNTELVTERKNAFISWRSLPDSEVIVNGTVSFEAAAANRGTIVTVDVHYVPPTGAIGRMLAKVFEKGPNFLMRQDLRRLKALIETGETPTVDGQPHGPRSLLTGVFRYANPDSTRQSPSLSGEIQEQRRIS